ncbi:MAG: hypothetical protein ACI4DS_02405 [Eubacterium sp.]
MVDGFKIQAGQVTKYTTHEKKKITHLRLYHIIYFICFLSCILITFFVFKLCISNKSDLSDTIALGSIFATFGSAIVSVFSITLSNVYEHFCCNINILFKELCPQNEWHRWPFIKRESHSTLYNKELTYQILENSKITFNVGSHNISIFLPTVREDFFDLPNWRSLKTMLSEAKNYESYIINNIRDSATSLMIWDCVLDNFKSIALYKLSKLMIVIGGSFIFASFIFAFFYTLLPF